MKSILFMVYVMAIDVICSGCFKRFQVSDEFAGRSGPCPGCKTIIAIPAPEDQLVIEEPEHKPSSPGAHTKIDGIARRVGFFKRFEVITLCSLFASAAFVAVLTRTLQGDPVGVLTYTTGILFGLGLVLLSLASSLLGYGVLKDSEVEAFDRRTTIIRSAITAAIYCLIAVVFVTATLLLDHHDDSRTLILAIVGIACFAIASFAPMVLYEMELLQGGLHVAVMICMTSLYCLLANNFHQWLLAP
ncbi:MAG TPA: hypothetical protein EYM79_10765 [Planctomycetes bacterium]|nr:hypothetical protein [Planctomycetaceae bacterium]HIN54785.1 hypothetical protein [Planctomycetota bacterium]